MTLKALAALMASLVLAACASHSVRHPDPTYHYNKNATPTHLETDTLTHINAYRHRIGLETLRFDPLMYSLAVEHSEDMLTRHHLDHKGFKDRINRVGNFWCVENALYSSLPLTGQQIFTYWQQSPHHDRNLRNPHIQWVGISVVGDWVTMEACG